MISKRFCEPCREKEIECDRAGPPCLVCSQSSRAAFCSYSEISERQSRTRTRAADTYDERRRKSSEQMRVITRNVEDDPEAAIQNIDEKLTKTLLGGNPISASSVNDQYDWESDSSLPRNRWTRSVSSLSTSPSRSAPATPATANTPLPVPTPDLTSPEYRLKSIENSFLESLARSPGSAATRQQFKSLILECQEEERLVMIRQWLEIDLVELSQKTHTLRMKTTLSKFLSSISLKCPPPTKDLDFTETEPVYTDQELLTIIDIFQYISDSSSIPREFVGLFINFLYEAAKHRNIVPPSLELSNVVRLNTDPVACGAFSDVYKGVYQDKLVALKVLRSFSQLETLRQDICREAILWRQLHHSNVLQFYGLCSHFPGKIALVSPWAENGDLRNYLIRYPHTPRMPMARGIAAGMEYMHSRSPYIIHGDLRPANIVVDVNKQPRITDFGLAKSIDSQSIAPNSSTRGTCPFRYLAPELIIPVKFGLEHSIITKESDVYAFGMTLYEVFSGKSPFHGKKDVEVIYLVTDGQSDKRPERPSTGNAGIEIPDLVWHLVNECWQADRHQRPSFFSITLRLLNKDETVADRAGELEGVLSSN